MKELSVHLLKNRVEIVVVTMRRTQPFASANLANQVRLANDLVAGYILSIARGLPTIDRLPVHLGQKNVRNGPKHAVGSTFQQVRKAHQQPPIPQTNRIVDVRKSEKFD